MSILTEQQQITLNRHKVLEALKIETYGFDMREWIEVAELDDSFSSDAHVRFARAYSEEGIPDCGTTCCIGGLAQIVLRLDYNSEVLELLGLSESQAENLFYPQDNSLARYSDITRAHAIKALEYLIEHNDVPADIWQRVGVSAYE